MIKKVLKKVFTNKQTYGNIIIETKKEQNTMGKVIEFKPQTEQQTQQHVTDDYFKPSDKFYSIDGKQLSEHQMKQKGYEPITTTGKIVKAIVSPLGYIFGILVAIVTDIKDGTLLDWFI